ncbi:polysaccharide pyruvyl transferase family protein [Cellulosimicrobium arenosum]|uniref:Polysaccharide pyruvyl transferase family protein n=1 Tax=Cellulosimicrobium arenosum TaxID=2708133 RepID=A0A927J1P8_9MICO|nr:polysaccharide pyruvyl transferase family protein [Cellulosimicrobium arenosum]MBD8080175.1 polysaccharide pyruvyl transferase family protein [Cellulosimicrobium arenosum]
MRGQLTRSRVRSTESNEPALGDPGLLAHLLQARPPKKRWAIGVLPHYHDASDPFVDRLLTLGHRVRRIEVAWTPEEVVHEVGACDVLLSSSLHGLIVADSLGVPNVHLKFGDRLMGGDYKFRDYNSVFRPGRHRAFRPEELPMKSASALRSFVEQEFVPPTGLRRIQRDLVKALS